MKKILLIIMVIFLVGCQSKNQEEIDKTANLINNPPTITPEATPDYVDTNPIVVGIYKDRKLITEYNKKFKDQTDIAIFSIFFTNEKNVGNGNFKTTWKKYYNEYEDISEYKIGFEIDVEINGEKVENVMLNPKNQHKIYPTLYAYLYDDIHNSGYYSHVTMDDVKDNTVYSSIKLYLHKQTNTITSPITLTVFTYKDENDFIDGHYRGNSKYTITINNK
jgi:hypothetical protein